MSNRDEMRFLLREPMAPTTTAAGARAGTNVAATGRMRSATGNAFLTAGMIFLLMKVLCLGASVAAMSVHYFLYHSCRS